MKKEIIIFEKGEVKLNVNIKEDTVWLSLGQMSELFGRDRTVITRHINNIFKEKELNKEEVCAKFAHTTHHGAIKEKSQVHLVDYYNLDVVISVGYRVKSNNGVIFRRWANKVLRDYLIKGYSINKERLNHLEKTIKLIDIANRNNIEDYEAKPILNIIDKYSKTIVILKDYDNKELKRSIGTSNNRIINYHELENIINKLKQKEKSKLFALEKSNGLKSIINDIYQTFDGNFLYESVEEKAANFLYLIIKNHIFIDGNKRIAAVLFIYFLDYYELLYKNKKEVIDNNTLVAVTLLIAKSNPKEKELMIDLIINFIGT